MAEETIPRVLAFKPLPGDLEAVIREIAIADRYVFLGNHTRERMEERGITRLDALRVLQRGAIAGEKLRPGCGPANGNARLSRG